MDREWTEQDLRTFAEGAQTAFETVLLDELPQDTGWQDEGLQVSYSLCNGRVSCVLHRTVRADGKLWRITMSAPLAGNLLPEERMSARERELCREDLNHDFLSGVYNRRYLETVIAAELAQGRCGAGVAGSRRTAAGHLRSAGDGSADLLCGKPVEKVF